MNTYPMVASLGYNSNRFRCNHDSYIAINIEDKIHPTWIDYFKRNDFSLNELLRYLYVSAYENGLDVFPLPQDVMNVFSMDPGSIKVVLIGQDPYPQTYTNERGDLQPVANGYSFATNSGQITPSLERIFSAIGEVKYETGDFSLRGWIRQGVFLLNKTPVVWCIPNKIRYAPDNEKEMKRLEALCLTPETKWGSITKNICLFITNHINSLSNGTKHVYFILLGKKAFDLSHSLTNYTTAPHPSTRNDVEFKADCFIRTPGINWRNA
jgi:uracil DNA glycosylase